MHKGADTDPADRVTWNLLRAVEAVLWDTCIGMYWCANLVEWDCLCNLCWVQVSRHATSTDTDPGQTQDYWKESIGL